MAFAPTPEQQAILDHEIGQHARILAGPGTGKSATVVGLINRLLTDRPELRIKLLTFTRAATAELARKVVDHPALAAQRPSTVHSFAISILLQNPGAGGFPEPLRVADDWETKHTVYPTLARRIGVRADRINGLFRELAANWECLEERQSPRVAEEDRRRFLGGWQEHRRIFGYTLLSELPYALRGAMEEHPDLVGLEFDLVVVDEYQDLNACDLEVLRKLAERDAWIVGVGDDEQSIYSFRRAAPEGIRRFAEDYPDSADYPLTITHRCGSRIVDWARHVIEGDPDRDPARRRLTARADAIRGEAALLGFPGETSESRGVADLIQGLIETEHVPPSEILVLLRSDHNGVFSTPLKEQLADRGIPVTDPESVSRVLATENNRRLLALCRLLANRTDSLAWATLFILEPGIGFGFIERIYEEAQARHVTFGEVAIDEASHDFPDTRGAPRARAQELARTVLGWIETHALPAEVPEAWGNWIVESNPPEGFRPDPEMVSLLASVDELAEANQELSRYLNQLVPIAKDIASAKADGVRIMSMAASKGLTVQATIVPALEEGIVPRPDADLAEERRLLYVALTRSTKFLFGTYARRRRGPTARTGRPQVAQARRVCGFLNGGPVVPEDGQEFLRRRF